MAYGLFGPGRRIPGFSLPNLEGLAGRGAFFDRAFVTTSLCSPSRATILSGLYAHTHGVMVNETTDVPDSVMTYPEVLRGAGYETAYIGKWHMDSSTDMPRPGFDYWLSFRGQGVYLDPVINENGKVTQRTGYITDMLTSYAVTWLRQPHNRPFLLVLSHKAPHQPAIPAARHAAALADLAVPEPASFDDSLASKPAWQRQYVRCGGGASALARCPDPQPPDVPPWSWDAKDADRLDYLRALLGVDESVGTVLSTLSAQGMARSTYIVFLSDNGLLMGEHRMGDKRVAYEESMRIPLVITGAEVAARRVDATVLNLDLAPTILELAGASVPMQMQGRSIVRLLRGENAPVHYSFLCEYASESFLPVVPDMQGIRTSSRKYVTYPGTSAGDELYDLVSDPTEMRNLAAAPEWAATRNDLRQQLDRLLQQTGAIQ